MKNKVVVTGMGVAAPNGVGIQDFWASCLSGSSCAAPIPRHWHKYADRNSKVWSPLPDFEYSRGLLDAIERKRFDPVSQIAIGAADEAIRDANLVHAKREDAKGYAIQGINPHRFGVFIGTSVGGAYAASSAQSHHMLSRIKIKLKKLLANTPDENDPTQSAWGVLDQEMIMPRRINPFTVSMAMPNAPASNLALLFGAKGVNNTLSAACASGTVAIGQAYYAIKNGLVDIAIAGGSEFMHDDYGSQFHGFDMLGTLAQGEGLEVNKPFDNARTGFLFSQGGAGILIIESEKHAKSRGATILAEVVGFSENCDAYSIMSPDVDGSGAHAMLTQLLVQSGLAPSQIGYINAHGTGTILNDSIEASLISKLFPNRPHVNTTKSLIGHTFGAGGAIEAIVSVLSLVNQHTHGCRNLVNPLADLNFVVQSSPIEAQYAITQSFAFGGINASLAIARYNEN